MTRRTFLLSTGAAALLPTLKDIELNMSSKESEAKPNHVVIIGGSFAGLAAALQLGRARRHVVIVDTGLPRNRFANHSHGFLTQDGQPPKKILEHALDQLKRYPTVKLINGEAMSAVSKDDLFEISIRGQDTLLTRRLILAYGVRDELPTLSGLKERWGKTVFHCPYCHGYEVKDLPLGVYGKGPSAVHQSIMLKDWSDKVTLFLTDPSSLSVEERERIKKRGVLIIETPAKQLLGSGTDLQAIELANGTKMPIRGLLIAPTYRPSANLHESLGCETTELPNGKYLKVDDLKKTSVNGVYAAGDLARPMHSVTFAVADGSLAGSACHQSMLAEDWH